MPEINIPLAVQADAARDVALGSGSLINCYAEPAESGLSIVACDGFSLFATPTGAAAGQLRGMLNLDDQHLYYVSGTRLQAVTPAGGVTHLAEYGTDSHVYFARNRKGADGVGAPQIMVVSGDGGFRLIENNIVSTPSLDAEIPRDLFNSVCHMDGYFVITLSNGEFYITSIDEGSEIDALEFASAQANPDGLTRGLVRGRDLVLMGPRSTEFWNNTGATDFPFERAHAESYGLYAPAAAVPVVARFESGLSDTIIWPATTSEGAYAGVCLLDGYSAVPISTGEVDRAIRAQSVANDIRGFSYTRNDGTSFYVIAGTTTTYEFNLRTRLWHKRESDGSTRWQVSCAEQFNGSTIFGDYDSAALYQRDDTVTGSETSTLTLEQSRTHGETYQTARSASIGGSNARNTRIRFNRFGRATEDGVVFRLVVSNAFRENGTQTDMTIITPALAKHPKRLIVDAIYVDTIPGVSATAYSRGIKGMRGIVRATEA